jgi:hypothetical protein
MAPRTARTLPLRRDKFNVSGFVAYLAANGCEVGTPTNPYEVVRYRAYWQGSKAPVTHIVYAKETGLLTWMGGSQGHYRSFLDGAALVGIAPPFVSKFEGPQAAPAEQRLSKGKHGKTAASRAALLARDGDDCWFCGEPLGDDCTIEHLVPKSRGGANALANYALAHKQCNAAAANKPLVEKIAMRARLRGERV